MTVMRARRLRAALLTGAAGLALAGCSGDLSSDGTTELDPNAGPLRENRGRSAEGLVFGEEITSNNIRSGALFNSSTGEADGDALPVNKYLWRASLDTLSFLPLDSTDPFTGVIASEWSATPETPNERFKVTVYLVRPALEASSLKVAVFRQEIREDGVWRPLPVSPETAAQLESAILTRARQLRIAAIETGAEG